MLVTNNDSSITAPKGESMPTDCYEKERLRQASKGFDLGHYFMAGGAVIFLAIPLLFLSGNIPAATAKTAGGLASGAIV
jgi:nitrate reductase gamma subunit